MAAVLRAREWDERGWSRPRSCPSPWDGHQVWVLDFTQEGIQERVTVKGKKVNPGRNHAT